MNGVRALGTIMGIWAHPDDEIYAMGGVFAMASETNQKTICITATRGEKGVQDESRWPSSELAQIRTNEMKEALNILGVDHHHWLDYQDGNCKNIDTDQAAKRLADYIDYYRPDSLITFGPDGMTGHDDHKAVSKWVDIAINLSKAKPKVYHTVITTEAYESLKKADAEFNMFFNITNPCMCSKSECSLSIDLDKDALDAKMRALESMPSQTEYLLSKHRDSVQQSAQTESFMLASNY